MGTRDDAFWAKFLGVEPDEWNTPGVSHVPHVGLHGYQGFWCFRRNDRVVVSAPDRWVPRLRETFSGWEPDRLMDSVSLQNALGDAFERSIGPVFQGALDPECFSERAPASVRKLTTEDAAAVASFRAECGIKDWASAGLEKAEAYRHACFDDDRVTALAGYRAWEEDAGDPCVLTCPHFRGGGRGAAVVSAVVREALAKEKLLLYQTLESNEQAVRIALSLGYARYASHVAVRLKRASL